MGDKSSWDTLRQWRFSLSNPAVILFYLHQALILWYLRPPNSMLCRRCGLCSLRNSLKLGVVWGGRAENVSKTFKNRILLQGVRTLLSLIVVSSIPRIWLWPLSSIFARSVIRRYGECRKRRNGADFLNAFPPFLQIATLIQDLRKELDRLLENKIENPSLDLTSCARESRIIDTIVRLISTQ